MNRLEPLTGLRGVAASSVLIAHALETSFNYGAVPIFHPFASRLAYFGMSLFFVLSGFVIEYNYADSFAVRRLPAAAYGFFVARFARLYPLYIVSIVCSLTHIPHPNFTLPVTLAYLTLTQSWFNLEEATFPPDWSISAEWFFYFAFIPLTIALVGLRRPMATLIIFCVAATVGLIVLFYLWSAPLAEFVHHWFWHGSNASAEVGAWFYLCPYLRLLEFISGVLAAKIYRMRKSSGTAPTSARLVIFLGLAWCGAVILVSRLTANSLLENILPNFIFAPALAPLMVSLCQYETGPSRLLSSRPALFLGEISFSIYIWSFFVMDMMAGHFGSPRPSTSAYANSTVKMAIIIALTVVFAYGSYLLIEVPSRRRIRGLLMGNPRTVAAV